jgi:hypothetical protein
MFAVGHGVLELIMMGEVGPCWVRGQLGAECPIPSQGVEGTPDGTVSEISKED